MKKIRNKSGIILFIVLWALVILSALTISLGRSTNIDLAITKNVIGKIKSKYIAWAAIMYGINQIQIDTQDGSSKDSDTLNYCGISPAIGTAEGIFKDVEFSEGKFTVQYELQDKYDEQKTEVVYGMYDEDRKINLNTLTDGNVQVFIALLELFDVGEDDALTIGYSLLDWKDEDNVMKQTYSAEDLYYVNLDKGYHCKNALIESMDELLLIKGITPQIYDKIKKYVTVFPEDGSFRVNFDTASETVLKALARSASGPSSNTEESDADSLVEKILEYRRGDDGLDMTEDDQVIEAGELAMNAKENVIFQVIDQYRTKVSNTFRISAHGLESGREVPTHIEAIVLREDLSIVYWQRN